MINLIPPPLKQEHKFARWNTQVVRYLKILVVLVIVMSFAFGSTYVYLTRRIHAIDQDLAAKQTQVDSYASTVTAARALNDRVAAIKAIQATQPKFSLLLDDIAKFSLKGTTISSITLTGDDAKPVQINATAPNYTQAVSLRDALASSPRISGADIVSISGEAGGGGSYAVSIVIGFKPGEAR